MGLLEGQVKYLNEGEMEKIHEGVTTVLEDVGMKIDHPEALKCLENIGCNINTDNVAKFPKRIVNRLLEKFKRDYTLRSRDGLTIPMRFNELYFSSAPKGIIHNFSVNAGGFPAYVLDLDGNRRMANMEDVRNSIRLADALENIDLVGLPCSANEVPTDMQPIVMTAELLKNTNKPGGIEAWSTDDIEYISEMALVIRGSKEELKEKPFLVGYGEIRSPFCLDFNAAEIFIEYIKRGMPQSLDSMPYGGITAPASTAGVMVQGFAETLAGLILGYAVDENAWVSIDITPGLMDMQTMFFPYAGADRIPLLSAVNQMMREFYGRPGGCHGGKTDACQPGVQAGFEKALSIMTPVLSGATGVGTLGQVEAGNTFSFVQLVIDNEIVGYIKRILKGFEVNNDTLAVDVIKDVGIDGQYLQHEHTLKNYKSDFYFSELLERTPWDTWTKKEVKGMEALAREKAIKIINDYNPQPLEKHKVQEIDRIVEMAYRNLSKI